MGGGCSQIQDDDEYLPYNSKKHGIGKHGYTREEKAAIAEIICKNCYLLKKTTPRKEKAKGWKRMVKELEQKNIPCPKGWIGLRYNTFRSLARTVQRKRPSMRAANPWMTQLLRCLIQVNRANGIELDIVWPLAMENDEDIYFVANAQ